MPCCDHGSLGQSLRRLLYNTLPSMMGIQGILAGMVVLYKFLELKKLYTAFLH